MTRNLLTIGDLEERLCSIDALRPATDGIQSGALPAIEPKFADEAYLSTLSPRLESAVRNMGIQRLYQHQAAAITSILSGDNVVIATPTASGKTLCFNIPITEILTANRNAHALVLHPMKALTNDQRFQLEHLWRSSDHHELRSWVYDGDTPQDHRAVIRKAPPQVIFTNPEMLNMTFLGRYDLWLGFLRQLRFVVIDEIHEYRGFFGSNVSLLLRRFFRKLDELGAAPQVVLASATCKNPVEHARALTGKTCRPIVASNMRPVRDFLFVNPAIEAHQFHRIYPYRIALAGLACADAGLTTLVFTPSRKFCEDVARLAQKKAREMGMDPDRIVAYRSGYTSDQRREIEERMRNGEYNVVFATNALEVGIDVGALDAVLLAGFPDSIMSAWQRIGRAGRSWTARAFVLYYAMNNPFDRFMADNLRLFLDKPLDNLAVNYENEELVRKHLPCLLYEKDTMVVSRDRDILGEELCVRAMEAQAHFRKVSNPAAAPHVRLPIRAVGGGLYKLMVDGKEIGSISEEQKLREAYLGAIYVHMGKQYRVRSHGAGEIELVPGETNRRTLPKLWSVATELKVFEARRFGGHLCLYHGLLTIYNNYGGYREEDEFSGETYDDVTVDPVAHQRLAHAVWVQFEDGESNSVATIHALPLIERMSLVAVPFVVPCDRYDVSGLAAVPRKAFYLYETVPGGIGIATKVFGEFDRVISQGITIAEACPCEYGCPKCVALPRDAGEKVLKRDAVEGGRAIQDAIRHGTVEELDLELMSWC